MEHKINKILSSKKYIPVPMSYIMTISRGQLSVEGPCHKSASPQQEVGLGQAYDIPHRSRCFMTISVGGDTANR